jgi:diketogulonate reductase-like aldo/keto reductase
MTDIPSAPGSVRIVRAHVYYDPQTGAIVWVHRIAVPVGESLDDERLAQEVDAFEESLTQEQGRELTRLVVDDEALREAVAAHVSLRVDPQQGRLLRD